MYKTLQLQRASAGSGKTYTLAKKFLWYFLTIREEDGSGKRRLRTAEEIRDSLRHILAVTFTNKATNEMQERIIEKLDALAFPPPKGADYMSDFVKELGVKEEDVSRVSRMGLLALLNNFSDFHVSTIDSFFQMVLRTFAYESNLNDTYQVELDNDYLARVGTDAVFEDIEHRSDSSEAAFWIRRIMSRTQESDGRWNIFQKSPGGSSKTSENDYGRFLNIVKAMENENFKAIRGELEEYFDSGVNLMAMYEELRAKYDRLPVEPHRQMIEEARRALAVMERVLPEKESASARTIEGKMKGYVKNVLGLRYNANDAALRKAKLDVDIDTDQSAYRKRASRNSEYVEAEISLTAVQAAVERWLDVLNSPEWRHWTLYEKTLPYLGLLGLVRRGRRDYLELNNAVELSETASILKGIINDDDTPFIYERIGSRLNHFLIDEFQDTSRMQWDNIYPLLSETQAYGNENLIIGDAKQSIYRFRNADSSLISSEVARVFPDVEQLGDSKAENTNWRSCTNVVRFNNLLFHKMSEYLTDISNNFGIGVDFKSLYSNVKQPVSPKQKDSGGFVSFKWLINRNKDGGISQTKPKIDIFAAKTADTVAELVARGYKMRDIAVLCRKKAQSEAVIRAFVELNKTRDGINEPHIEFVSEESLKLNRSAAVKVIVAVLESIARGSDPVIREGEESIKKGVVDYEQVETNLSFFMLSHSDELAEVLVDKFLAGEENVDAVGEMLGEIQAVTLPSLVEACVARFIPAQIRKREAAFIAAFQDVVLEYCDSHPGDIASFLAWWTRKRETASISSPEETDAVRIMTIHKSKGLEFPVVIIPDIDGEYGDQAESMKALPEWRWLKPVVLEADHYALPPYIPVKTAQELLATSHSRTFREFTDAVRMDALNIEYVAYTRAVRELYILSSLVRGGTGEVVYTLMQEFIAPDTDRTDLQTDAAALQLTEKELTLLPDEISITEGDEEIELTVGAPFTSEQLSEFDKEKRKAKEGAPQEAPDVLDDYIVYSIPGALRFRADALPEIVNTTLEEDEDDPRSEGNVLHAIMEGVIRDSDLKDAIKRIEIQGIFKSANAKDYYNILREALDMPEVKKWFDGSYKVLTERSLVHAGSNGRSSEVKRPDRIMMTEDGKAVVVDYKFGLHTEDSSRYKRQVRQYVEMLKSTGLFTDVKGYLWYVRLGKIEYITD